MPEERRNIKARAAVVQRVIDSVVQNPSVTLSVNTLQAWLDVPFEAAQREPARRLASSGLVREVERLASGHGGRGQALSGVVGPSGDTPSRPALPAAFPTFRVPRGAWARLRGARSRLLRRAPSVARTRHVGNAPHQTAADTVVAAVNSDTPRSAISGRWSDAARAFPLNPPPRSGHLVGHEPPGDEQVIESHVRIPRGKRVADQIRVECRNAST